MSIAVFFISGQEAVLLLLLLNVLLALLLEGGSELIEEAHRFRLEWALHQLLFRI